MFKLIGWRSFETLKLALAFLLLDARFSAVNGDCDFDAALCTGYQQDNTDDFDWSRHQGPTGSSATGPSIDHTTGTATGYYMYIETSRPRALGDAARLISPSLSANTRCLEFWYHMYGSGIGELNVYLKPTGSSLPGNLTWSKTGDKGDIWQQARVHLEAVSNFNIVFEGVRGTSVQGDIAIDDVIFRTTPCGGECDFDTTLCGYQQDSTDDFDWTRQTGSTLSTNTGPSSDHTTGQGYYMYIETSPQTAGDAARLITPRLPSNTRCLEFWYHMYGSDTEELNVYLRPAGISQPETRIWSLAGNQGDVWHYATVSLVAGNNAYIVFEGVRGSDFQGDIAIDDVSVRTTSCGGCDFDTTPWLCGYQQDNTDDFDWTHHQGSTGSSATGPSADHTTGTATGYYMYIETSSPQTAGDVARLITPRLPSNTRCLEFWYHMYGSDTEELRVYKSSSISQLGSLIWLLRGEQGNSWYSARVILAASSSFYIVFEGVRGSDFRGDIAIDDVSVFRTTSCGLPSEITNDPQNVTQSLHQSAVFSCMGRGKPMPGVYWRHDGIMVSNGAVTTTPGHFQHTFVSTLALSSVQRADNGEYTCTAANSLNTDTSRAATLTVLERPGEITVSVTSTTSTTVQATADVGFTGNLPVTAMQRKHRRSEETSWCPWTSVGFSGTRGTFEITRLAPDTNYIGEVRANNSEGRSIPAQFHWRTREAPPGPPSNLWISSTSSHLIGITWQRPAVTNGVITHYSIRYGQTTNCSDSELSFEMTTSDNATSQTFDGLIPYTMYIFRVRGFTSAGPGNFTDCLDAMTAEYIPTKPTSVELKDVHPCNCESVNQVKTIELQASWRRPQHVYGELRGYNLKLRQHDRIIYDNNVTRGLQKDELIHLVSDSNIHGLKPAQEYSLVVYAYNDVYVGEVSTSAENQTSDGCPTAPSILEMKQDGICGANWTAPSQPWGNITGYTVEVITRRLVEDSLFASEVEQVSASHESDLEWNATIDSFSAFSLITITVRAVTCAEGEVSEEVTCEVTRIEPPASISKVTSEASSLTSTSFDIVLPSISQRSGPISCYQILIVPMGKDETLEELIKQIGEPQEILTTNSPKKGRTLPYVAVAFSNYTGLVTIGTDEPCTDRCCHVGEYEEAQQPHNRPLSSGSRYTATVRAYVNTDSHTIGRNTEASWAQTSGAFMQPITTVSKFPLVPVVAGVVAAVVVSFAAGAALMFCRRQWSKSPKRQDDQAESTDLPLDNITYQRSEVQGASNQAFENPMSEIPKKRCRRLSEIDTVSDVADWLGACNLDEYAAAFRDHHVDGNAMRYLDDSILKELIPHAGPRAKFKGILAELQNQKQPEEKTTVMALHFWEIPRASLKVGRRLGSGNFGQVRLGEVRQRGLTTTVAVKTLKEAACDLDRRGLLGELEIMVTVGRHDNIISLIGACTKDGPLCIVVEYAPNGCLKDWLKGCSVDPNVESVYRNQAPSRSVPQLPMKKLIQFGIDVASGMSHLAAMQCIHRDLAARNVLLGDNMVAKVSDFGLSRDIYEDNEYNRSTKGRLPLRWMAHESLFYNLYTTQSDVWSFGVLLWEIMTMGKRPYDGMSGKEMMDMIEHGGRLENPRGCPHDIYILMTSCWMTLPDERPTFPDLKTSLQRTLENY